MHPPQPTSPAPSIWSALRSLPVVERFACIVLLFVLIVAALLFLGNARMEIVSAAGAYIAGEGQWSKAQRDATDALTRYAATGDERDYAQYHAALAIPLGDRDARLALEAQPPDILRAHRGFLAGQNHPDDIPGMIRLFLRYRHVPYLADPIAIWAEADRHLLKLRHLGETLHDRRSALDEPDADAADAGAFARKIASVSHRLRPLEDGFSRTLSAGARWFRGVLLVSTCLVTVAMLAIGVLVSWMLLGHIKTWETRYQHLLNAANDAIVVTDAATGVILEANRKAEELSGLSRLQLLGLPLDRLVPLAERPAHREFLASCVHEGRVTRDDVHVRHASGRLIPVETSASATVLAGRRVIQSILRDVSERQWAARALRQSEARWRAISELTSDWAYGYRRTPDGELVLEWVTEAFTRMTGFTLAEAQARGGFVGLVHPDDVAQVREREQFRLGGQPHTSAIRMVTKRGEVRWVLDHGIRIWDDSDTGAVHFSGAVQDITERTRAEEALRESEARKAAIVEAARQRAEEHAAELAQRAGELTTARNAALEAARIKSEFLANMSHEIRTPMTAILGFTDLLSDPAASAEERASCLATIRRNGEHLQRIINDILDLSKIEAGRMTLEKVACSPVQLVSEVTSLMRPRALGKGLRFAVDYLAPLPARIQVDPTRLRQILMNLIGNAIKFTEGGGVHVTVALVEGTAGIPSRLRFEIADTGIGIAPAAQAELFAPFSQADASTTRRFGGSGLGLAISKRLAEMLGGDITAESAPGAGSTFVLSVETGPLQGVPMLTHPHDAAVLHSTNGGAAPPPPVRLSGRILLAEDAPDNQRLISFYLRQAGARVETADDGRIACATALAAAEAGTPFDVILMDMQMPHLDGYGATARLRAAGYDRPIVALTAHAMEGDREKCLRAGCDDFLTKPIDPRALLETLARQHRDAREPDGAVPADAAAELAAITATFVDGLAERAGAIERSLAAGDLETLAVLSHRLKGTAGGFGFGTITAAAAELERSTKAGRPHDELRRHVGAVAALCRQAAHRESQTGAST